MIGGVRMQLNLLRAALEADWCTYKHWERWKDSKNPQKRRLALLGKAHGVVAYDRIMRIPYDLRRRA